MTLRIDPERNEVQALKQAIDWRGREVLEIGCGDGRLTRRLAALGARVRAIDPDAALVRAARLETAPKDRARVRFRVGNAGLLEYPAAAFDAVVLSWSL
jgi:2-polyprenyl-6-hydroxyphenyl methylase / 3-demethylubiquinone-9 3-methyltransferase